MPADRSPSYLLDRSCCSEYTWVRTVTLLCIEPSDLETGAIDVGGHLSAQRVYLSYQMSFGRASNGRITRHECDVLYVKRGEERPAPEPRRSQGCFTACMSRSYDHDIVVSIQPTRSLSNHLPTPDRSRRISLPMIHVTSSCDPLGAEPFSHIDDYQVKRCILLHCT